MVSWLLGIGISLAGREVMLVWKGAMGMLAIDWAAARAARFKLRDGSTDFRHLLPHQSFGRDWGMG
jgi:hypothetical protein